MTRSRFLILPLLLLVVPLLGGWKFLSPPRAWDITDTGPGGTWPIEFHAGDVVPQGLDTHEEKWDLIQQSYDHWGEEVPCSPIEAVQGADINNSTQGFGASGLTTLTFNDPTNALGSSTLAAALSYTSNGVVTNNGVTFAAIAESHIVFNDWVVWGDAADISAASCFNRHDFMSTTTHEIGHTIGLGHSCEDGEACSDPLLRGATMYWSGGSCSSAKRIPNEDDAAAINVAYGVSIDFEIEPADGQELVGPAPLTASMDVPSEYQATVVEYEWNFGDGTEHIITTTAESVEHTWEEEGQYTVTLSILGEDAECGGEYEAEERKVGVVLVCNEPRPAFEFVNEGDFTVQIENVSDLGAFGCITDFVWILDGDEDSALRTYEPTYVFDDNSSHTVTLRASGPGGETEITQTIDPTKQSGEGCSASVAGTEPVGLLALLIGMMGLVPLARRRR
ncbi:MAG: PKD domain-containing protein [Deltaproteobacteria bacterium]|nr:PKD domain-containing protein [Deltaproteobacteria bacterium]